MSMLFSNTGRTHRNLSFLFGCFASALVLFLLIAGSAVAEPPAGKDSRKSVTLDEERLLILKRDIGEEILRYRKLKEDAEKALTALEEARQTRVQKIAKMFEAMPPEEAAEKLESVDDDIAILIISSLNPRKAGRIMAQMATEKAASLSQQMVHQIKRQQEGREKSSP